MSPAIVYGRGKPSPVKLSAHPTHQESSSKTSNRYTLTDQYFSLLLLVLVKAGLLDVGYSGSLADIP